MPMPYLARVPRTVLAAAGGLALAASLGAIGLARRDKPLHAWGRTADGRLVFDGDAGSGVPVLDTAATHPVTLRVSRAMSVPLPVDVAGLAVRAPGLGRDGRPADILLASTGTSTIGRYVLRLVRDETRATMTTLLPQDGPAGPVLLRVDPRADGYALSWSGTRGGWRAVGRIDIDGGWGPDRPLRFRPTQDPVSGLTPPRWVRLLRAPAYRTAHLTAPTR